MAEQLAYAERLAELNDTRYRRYDGRGVDAYSAEWGRIYAYETVVPSLAEIRHAGPGELRKAARARAEHDFLQELRRKDFLDAAEGKEEDPGDG